MEALAWHKSVDQSAFIIHVQVGSVNETYIIT